MTTVDFSDQSWFGIEGFDGYGRVEVLRHCGRNCLALRPQASTRADETHAALVTSRRSYNDFDATFHEVVTLAQLRNPGTPNPWERAWLLWHFGGLRNFYYFILKSNGWELGKADPAHPGGQRFLRTAESPQFPVGSTHSVRVRQTGSIITVDVDLAPVTSFEDACDTSVAGSANPYRAGRFGFYCEDSHVRFGGFSVTETAGPR